MHENCHFEFSVPVSPPHLNTNTLNTFEHEHVENAGVLDLIIGKERFFKLYVNDVL